MEYQLTSMQEKLNAIAQKFDNDLSSLFAAITFLSYLQSTVAEFCHYLETNAGRRNSRKWRFYNRQLHALQSLDNDESDALNFLGKYHSEHPLNAFRPLAEWLPQSGNVLYATDELF